MGQMGRTIATLAIATALWCAGGPVYAQGSFNEAIAGRAQGQGNSRLLVEAKEIVYDNDRNTVSAVGDVELNYGGRTLQADRVTYDRRTGRVYAEGNARLTEANGSVVTGSRFELSDDFRAGFIDSLQVEQAIADQGPPGRGRFSAPRAERAEGETTVFERGTYTACEPCKNNPERPPLWRVKAARIIHSNSERMIYYENATLELLGVPVAYVPYFWTPDPTVRRKTGFLAPHYTSSSVLGQGVSLPFFWALAPNYDLTLTPTYYSEQGFLGQVEWRHRLLTGAYNVRASGIVQEDPNAFLPAPLGPRDREARGSLETKGLFHLNERWRWGWDLTFVSDKWFLENYKIRQLGETYSGFREATSTIFLQGQGDRSWFEARGYYFQTLSTYDWQKQQPVVHPVIDYEKRIDGPQPFGGELALGVNVTSLSRERAQFQSASNSTRADLFPDTPSAGLFETCSVYERGVCLVRGLSGTYSRASTQLSWRRNFTDPLGQVWTPFAYVRADGFFLNPDTTGFPNVKITNFIGGDDEVVGRAMPAVGLEYRYPFVAPLGTWGTQQLSPIAQIIARPNEGRIGRLPNEDAQSFVFDDSALFDWDKFSGYDRAEGGVRGNAALKYSVTGDNGLFGEAMFGQSYHLAGRNSFAAYDLVNAGRESGLEFGVVRLCRPGPGLAEPPHDVHDEGALRRGGFRGPALRGGLQRQLLPVPALDDARLRPLRGAAGARLREAARGPRRQRHLWGDRELVVERLGAARPRQVSRHPQGAGRRRARPGPGRHLQSRHRSLPRRDLRGRVHHPQRVLRHEPAAARQRHHRIRQDAAGQARSAHARTDEFPPAIRRSDARRCRHPVRAAALPLAVTQGEPSGIGPEITLKAWLQRRDRGVPPFYVIGDPAFLEASARALGWPVPVRAASPEEASEVFAGALPVVPLATSVSAAPGRPDPATGGATVESIATAVAHTRQGRAGAVVTNPIAKHVLYAAGFRHPGHTEYLAALATEAGEPPHPVMMLWSEALAVVPVTVHIPLKDVPSALTADLIVRTARIVARDLQSRFGLSRPRLAVAGLNPHAGERATLGTEERDVIAPAIAELQAEGLAVTGPWPADTLFHAEARGAYDAALAMYHDQALVPIKTIAFDEAVNVTLGLPFVRTSPDHGTAFDIAGQGIARPTSLIAALQLAARLAAR